MRAVVGVAGVAVFAGLVVWLQDMSVFPAYRRYAGIAGLPGAPELDKDVGWMDAWPRDRVRLEQLWLSLPDGTVVHAVHVTPTASTTTQAPGGGTAGTVGTAVYCHGNGETIEYPNGNVLAMVLRGGMDVISVEYPGFGRSTGRPTEASIAAAVSSAALHARTRLARPHSRIVLYGTSLGGAAVSRALQQEWEAAGARYAGLVMDSTFSSIADVPGVPWWLRWAILHPLDSAEALRASGPTPVLVVSSRDDTMLLEATHAPRLVEAASADTHRRDDADAVAVAWIKRRGHHMLPSLLSNKGAEVMAWMHAALKSDAGSGSLDA